jgi:hypothetical protein
MISSRSAARIFIFFDDSFNQQVHFRVNVAGLSGPLSSKNRVRYATWGPKVNIIYTGINNVHCVFFPLGRSRLNKKVDSLTPLWGKVARRGG